MMAAILKARDFKTRSFVDMMFDGFTLSPCYPKNSAIEKPMSTDHPLRGIFLICCAVFLFAGSDALSKYLTEFYPVVMVLWVRYVVHTLLMAALLMPKSGLAALKTERPGLQILRGFCMVGTNMFFISALRFIPLAEGTSIIYISPLIITAFSWPMLGERVSRSQWIAVLIGFIGVLIVVRPGGALFTPVSLLALAAALSFSLYQLITGLLSGIITTVILPFFWKMPTLWYGLWMIGLGISALTSHMLMTQAYHHARPSILAPFTYLQLLFAGLIGYVLFDHIPDGIAMIGIIIICISGFIVAWGQRRPITPEPP